MPIFILDKQDAFFVCLDGEGNYEIDVPTGPDRHERVSRGSFGCFGWKAAFTPHFFQQVIHARHPAQLDDPARVDLLPERWTRPFGIQKLLAVPLIAHDQVIGLMALDHTDANYSFSQEQEDLAQAIGGYVAASIENARLFEQVQRLAITDMLTGIANRRRFFALPAKKTSRRCS